MKAFILAAGVSRRLYPHTYDIPKCLLNVGGKPIIHYQLEALKDIGVMDITGIVGVDVVRPAIDGGRTPGCTSNCPGHLVFSVEHTTSILNLTNVTIRNGYVSIYIYSTFNFFLQ